MLIYIARRILWTPVLLIISTFFVFFMGTVAPGDPAELKLGNKATPERIEKLRDEMGLNEPLSTQYIRYISKAAKGDFGESYTYSGKKVSTIIGPKLLVTLQLNLIASFLAIFIGIPLGFYAAKNHKTKLDPLIVLSSLIIYAIPVFLIAPLLILLFSVNLNWVPASGWNGIFSSSAILPALTVGIPGSAIYIRHMRSSTLDVINEDYVRTAYSKGLTNFQITTKHIIRNALLPILTLLGFSIAGIFSGSLIVEIIYGIPGVARLSLDAIFQRDFPILTAFVMIGSVSLIFANLIIDLAYTIIDPRIRLSGKN